MNWIMTSFEEKENEHPSCYFYDDSSAEEELVRVAEKLESIHQQEKSKVTEKKEKAGALAANTTNDRASPSLVSRSRLYCPESQRRNQIPDSSPTIPANIDLCWHWETDTVQPEVTNSLDGDVQVENIHRHRHHHYKQQQQQQHNLESKQNKVLDCNRTLPLQQYQPRKQDFFSDLGATNDYKKYNNKAVEGDNVDEEVDQTKKHISIKLVGEGEEDQKDAIVDLCAIEAEQCNSDHTGKTDESKNSGSFYSRANHGRDSISCSFSSVSDGTEDMSGNTTRSSSQAPPLLQMERTYVNYTSGGKHTIPSIPLKKIGVAGGAPFNCSDGGSTVIEESKNRVIASSATQGVKSRLRNPYLRKTDSFTTSPQQVKSSRSVEKSNLYSSQSMKKPTGFIENDGITRKSPEVVRVIPYIDPKEVAGESEVLSSHYAPPMYQEAKPPEVRRFTSRDHPMCSRHMIPVQSSVSLFTPIIVSSLWLKKFDRFNHFQSEMFSVLSDSDDNVVVSAPTGAGKSTIFEMAMARFLSKNVKDEEQRISDPNSTRSQSISKARKVVYIAPSKALCEERYADWSHRLESMNLGVKVSLITGQTIGDEEGSNAYTDMIAAHIIVTTPEKWDLMTRRWNEHFFLFASVKLLLVDEAHLLGDKSRGWCLESVITRMKTIHRASQAVRPTVDTIRTSTYPETNSQAVRSCFRTVAVSATLPNISEVAEFLQAKRAYTFDDSYRPVSLTKHVNALGRVGINEWRFWSNLFEHVPEIIKRFSHGKQSLIFCHSKKETQKVTELLIKRKFGNKGIRETNPPWKEPTDYMIDHGIAYHHAGMSKEERRRVEEAFLNKKIRYLAATSTLAVGVNLPAHLVIVVGTKAWRASDGGKGYQDIEVNELLQMVGRAGRPGLDSTGVAVVLTDNDSKKNIESLLGAGTGPARSNLVRRLPEVLNSEISQKVITNIDAALRWLQTTFLFACMKREKDYMASLQKFIGDAVEQLVKIGIVEIGQLYSLRPLAGSMTMNKHLLSFEQMKVIISFPSNANQCQILRSLSKIDGIKSDARRDEKRELKEFHKSELMKYKLPGPLSKFTVKDPSEKAFILLQSHISRHTYENEALNTEQIKVCNEAIKLLDAAQEFNVNTSRHGKIALECFKLQRSLNYRLWGESSGVFNQFDWIGASHTGSISNALIFHGIRTFQDALVSSEQTLDAIFARIKVPNLPENAGRIVKHTVSDLSRHRLRLSTDVVYAENSSKPTDVVCTLAYNGPTMVTAGKGGDQDLRFNLLAYTDSSERSFLMFEHGISSPSSFSVRLPEYPFRRIYIHLVGTWIGFDQMQILDYSDGILGITKEGHEGSYTDNTYKPSATTKKRKICEKGKWDYRKSKDTLKEPSPITPPNEKRHSETVDPPRSSNQPHSPKLCRESREQCRGMELASLNYGHTRNLPLAKAQITVPSSANVTPLICPTKKRIPSHGQGSRDFSALESYSRGEPKPNFSEYIHNPPVRQQTKSESPLEGNADTHSCTNDNNFLIGENIYLHSGRKLTSVLPVKASVETGRSVWKRFADHSDRGGEEPRVTDNDINAKIFPSSSVAARVRHVVGSTWNQSRKEQQRAQKRAFTEKRMNPFNSFSHDPNDSERFLENLSHQTTQQNSIIPAPTRAKMKQSSIFSNVGRYPISGNQDRRANRLVTNNPRQILREKAFEQQHEYDRMMTRQNYGSEHNSSRRIHSDMYHTPTYLSLENTRDVDVQQHFDQDSVCDFEIPYLGQAANKCRYRSPSHLRGASQRVSTERSDCMRTRKSFGDNRQNFSGSPQEAQPKRAEKYCNFSVDGNVEVCDYDESHPWLYYHRGNDELNNYEHTSADNESSLRDVFF